MPDGTTLPDTDGMRLTESAAKRIAQLIAQENDTEMFLRLTVSGGGCSGFQYGFALDKEFHDDDRRFARDGVSLVVDEISLDLLKGSEVDFVNDLVGSYFAVKNPNASSSCGCGSSFSI